MSSVIVEQALHGYDHGHGLLAASTELTRAEAALCERLSDLSGYLPPELSIPPHLTTFPCGRFYAVARTWPDRSGRRAGTVFTHTLLVPDGALGAVGSLAALTALHREPADVSDREPYRAPREFVAGAIVPWTPADARGLFAGIAAMMFGRAERPITVLTGAIVEPDLERLWQVLWPGARERLAVSTFALGARRAERGPFDILFVPPPARASVAELARTAGWWEPLRSAPPEVPGVHEQPWFGALLAQGPAWRDTLMRWCDAHELPMPAAGMIARLERMRALDDASRSRVTAARSRVDAIGAIWPRLPVEHPVMRASLRTLVSLQPGADDQPSPLRSLCDVVARAPVIRLAEIDPEFAASLDKTVRQEVGARASRSPVETFTELQQLLGATRTQSVFAAALDGAADALHAFADWSTRWALLLALDDLQVRHDVTARLFERVAAKARLDGLRALPSSPPECERLALYAVMLRVAVWTLDAPLLVESYARLDQHDRGARRGVAMVLAHHQPGDGALAAMDALPASIRVTWCLGEVDPAWRAFAALHGARWVTEASVTPDRFAAACAKVAHGKAMLCHWLDGASFDDVRNFLSAHPQLATLLVRAALEERGFETSSRHAVRAALASLSDAALSGPALCEALRADWVPEFADVIVTRLFPTLVRAFVSDTLTEDSVGTFGAPAWERCVEQAAFHGVREVSLSDDVTTRRWRESLPSCWSAFARWFPNATEGARATMAVLLITAIRSADANALDAAVEVGNRWFEGRAIDARVERLAAETLAVLKDLEPRSTERWLPVCFPLVYPALREGLRKPFAATPWKPYLGHWDEAEIWREWVTRFWFRRRLPPRGYLRAFQGNARDLQEALATIEHAWGCHEFFGALLDEVEVSPGWSDLRPMLAGLYNRHKPWLSKSR